MTTYTPPKVWDVNAINMGGKFGGTNRPTAGARHDQTLPRGDKPYQLYSLNTPNGVKVNIILEELKAQGLLDFDAYKEKKEEALEAYADQKAWAKKALINIAKAGYFSSDRTIEEYNQDIWKL